MAAKKLVIWVADIWISHAAVMALMAKGHRVLTFTGVTAASNVPKEIPAPDLILHPAAGWSEHLFDYLPAALKRARKRIAA